MKTSKPDLPGLWADICLNDSGASFEAFYRYLFSGMLKLSTYYIRNENIAEDIVSEIFVKCWENRKANISVINPESYLFIAVRNQSLKYLKKNLKVSFIDLGDAETHEPIHDLNPQNLLEQKELHKRLDYAIDTLPPQARIIFKLIKENGMKYKQVAEILSISPRTVQTQLFRAIAKLRAQLHTCNANYVA